MPIDELQATLQAAAARVAKAKAAVTAGSTPALGEWAEKPSFNS